MPEGDTVWRTARSLDRALSGAHASVDFRVPELATRDLSGVITSTISRGKHLLTRFDDQITVHTHLRMEGSWHLYRPGQPWLRPSHEARLVITTTDWVAVGFALGFVELVATESENDVVGHLGPDLLGPDWDEEEAVRRLGAQPERPIGGALLDQRNLAGIGNLYRAELCFVSGVHPATAAAKVDLPRLVRRAKAMLEANKERPEQSTTGDLRRDRRVWVYRRDGKPCRRCRTRILRGELGEPSRSTYWCPSCQPLATG